MARFDGWVTEMNDDKGMMNTAGDLSNGKAPGIDNLLYSADAEFSCFADLAVVSPGEYYKEGEGSLIQGVFDSRAYDRSTDQVCAPKKKYTYTLNKTTTSVTTAATTTTRRRVIPCTFVPRPRTCAALNL